MASGLLFGTGGTPKSTPPPRSTISGIERCSELGLDCMEIEFVQGVKMSEQTASQVKAAARARGIRLTAHGPYAINLNSAEPDKIAASKERILKTCRIGAACGAESIVFHAAFYGAGPAASVYAAVKKAMVEMLSILRSEGNRIWVRPELMGRGTQFGTLEELFTLSSELEGVLPAIDFAHWHARTGKFNSYDEFASVLRAMEQRLGRRALDNLHAHVSGIEYGTHGEIKHLDFQDSDFNYRDLVRALKDLQVKGFVVCESPNLEQDALLLRRAFEALPAT